MLATLRALLALTLVSLALLGHRRRGHGSGGGGGEEEHHEEEHEEGGSEAANRLYAWGQGHQAKIGGNYESKVGSFGSAMCYPQVVPQLGNAIQIAPGSDVTLFTTSNGEIWTAGNGEGAAGGIGRQDNYHLPEIGTPLKALELPLDNLTWIRGSTSPAGVPNSIPLYYEENKPNKEWWQRRGAYGPAIPTKEDIEKGRIVNGEVATWTIAAVVVVGAVSHALTTDGRALAWGSGNVTGALGSGDAYAILKPDEEQGRNLWPQLAPFWVLKEGPAQSETGFHDHGCVLVGGTVGTPEAKYTYDKETDPTWGNGRRANVLTGIKALAAATQFTWYLLTNGKVYYSGGSPGGGGGQPVESPYATEHTLWTTELEKLQAEKPGIKVEAIAGGRNHCVLLLSDKTIRFCGHNAEGIAGNGVEESATANTLEVVNPTFAVGGEHGGEHVQNVKAIASGDTSIKILLIDGTVWTTGSNFEYQQGLGGEKFPCVTRYTKIETCLNYKGEEEPLYASGRTVVAIAGGGEQTHEQRPEVKRQQGGVNGGDATMLLLSDKTIRVIGLNWEYEVTPGERFEAYGSLGHGDIENRRRPIEPIGDPGNARLTGITLIACGPNSMYAGKPGTVGVDSLKAAVSGTTVTVSWLVPGDGEPLKKWPQWREPDGFAVVLEGLDITNNSENIHSSPLVLPGTARSYTFTGVPATGHYLVKVAEKSELQTWNPIAKVWVESTGILTAVVGESTATAGKVTVTWTALPLPEPSLILEVRRREPYTPPHAKPMTLTAPLSESGPAITSLPAKAESPFSIGDLIVLRNGSHIQIYEVSAKTTTGTSPIPVKLQKPNFSYPVVGTSVIEGKLEDWKRCEPDLDPAALTATTAVPTSSNGVTGEDLYWRLAGGYEGVYGARTRVTKV
jgi:alpha-tubulin suppressor-like RCC1 family protein